MIVFAPTAPAATSRASSSRPVATRPGRPLSNHLVAACRARGCLPPSTRALHNARRRRATRGPGRAGAAAARRAVLLFPRGRRASLLLCRGVGELRCCGEQLFLWSGCARLWGRERLFARCALSRGVVKRPTEGGNAFSFASAATNATRCGCSAGLGRLPRRAAPVRLPACRRAIRGENATQRRVHNVRVSIELKLEGHLKAAARDVRSFACTYSCL